MAWPKPSAGGVRQWTLALANAFIARGYDVAVLTEAPRRKFCDEPLLDARVERVILGRGIVAHARLVAYMRCHPSTQLVAALNYYNLMAAILKPWFGRYACVTLTQHENLSADAPYKNPWVFSLIGIGVRRYFRTADAVVAVSQGVADDLRIRWNVPARRLRVIYNPAFDPRLIEKVGVGLPHPWLLSPRAPVILAAGRLHIVKGFDLLLRAFAQVRSLRDCKLIILGEGRERKNLEQLCASLNLGEDVLMPGRVADVTPWMRGADCFVLSSRREGFGNVLVEALSEGLPIVSTRCPSGPNEILEEGRWGKLVAVEDVAQLATAIQSTLQEPRPDPAALRARAKTFSVDRAIEQFEALWSEFR